MFQVIVLLSGALLMLIALFIKNERAFSCLSGFALSFVSSAIVAISAQAVFQKRDAKVELYSRWGMEVMYEYRQEANVALNHYQDNAKNQIDIIALGLNSWINARDEKIKYALQHGVKIRIITPHSDNGFLVEIDKAENIKSGSTRQSICTLRDRINQYKQYGSIEIKFYDALPMDMLFRVDDHLVVGPYLFGKASQQTITYEFSNPGEGFTYYSKYFETLWNGESIPPLPIK